MWKSRGLFLEHNSDGATIEPKRLIMWVTPYLLLTLFLECTWISSLNTRKSCLYLSNKGTALHVSKSYQYDIYTYWKSINYFDMIYFDFKSTIIITSIVKLATNSYCKIKHRCYEYKNNNKIILSYSNYKRNIY